MTLAELGAMYASKVAEVERENTLLRAEVKKLTAQLDDACDGIHERDTKIREREELIKELQEIAFRAARRTG